MARLILSMAFTEHHTAITNAVWKALGIRTYVRIQRCNTTELETNHLSRHKLVNDVNSLYMLPHLTNPFLHLKV